MVKKSLVVPVHMMALSPGLIRRVELIADYQDDGTDPGSLLSQVFHAGQNEVNPMPLPSLSPGDIIDLRGPELPFDGLFIIKGIGFTKINQDELNEIAALNDDWRAQYLIDCHICT